MMNCTNMVVHVGRNTVYVWAGIVAYVMAAKAAFFGSGKRIICIMLKL